MRLRHSLGYRISVEESVESGPQLADSLSLIDRLIDTRVTYIHASFSNALDQKPETEQSDASIVSILRDHIGNRVPLIAAGRISPPEQASPEALEIGLSLAAVGQVLVMNPEWVALARANRDGEIHHAISADEAPDVSIPPKLWAAIESAPGWFDIKPRPISPRRWMRSRASATSRAARCVSPPASTQPTRSCGPPWRTAAAQYPQVPALTVFVAALPARRDKQ